VRDTLLNASTTRLNEELLGFTKVTQRGTYTDAGPLRVATEVTKRERDKEKEGYGREKSF
jgi:hypothetical protein